MSDVLSQSEIDALLAAFASGEIIEDDNNNDSVTGNDVLSTVLEDSFKFTEKDIQALEYIHKEYTHILSASMFKNLNVKITLDSIQEICYEEFIRSIPYPTVATVFQLKPLEGCLLFEMSPSLVFQIADIFWGGEVHQKINLTELSENDKDISMQITRNFIKHLEKAWSKVLKVKSNVKYLETNPTEIKLITNNESVALLSFSIGIGKVNTLFNICIPYSSIEIYLDKLEIKNAVSESQSDNYFSSTNLNIKVILDNIQLTLGEIMGLEKGSILNTNKKYKNKVSILVEEKHCFNGEVGVIRNRKAIKVVDCLDKDV